MVAMIKTDRIISLGYNCEISFRLEDYFTDLDSYLFSWSYECDRDLFVEALKNIDDVFSGSVSLQEDHMFKCDKYNIKFHPRYDILPKVGDVTEEQIKEALNELESRIAHLKMKTKSMLQDSEQKIFLMKVEDKGCEDNILFINKIYGALKEQAGGNFILTAILEKDTCNAEIKALEKEGLKIRNLKKFANAKHTDIAGDISGWNKIISECAVSNSKVFKNNLKKRRKEIIPSMITNKAKQIIGRK